MQVHNRALACLLIFFFRPPTQQDKGAGTTRVGALVVCPRVGITRFVRVTCHVLMGGMAFRKETNRAGRFYHGWWMCRRPFFFWEDTHVPNGFSWLLVGRAYRYFRRVLALLLLLHRRGHVWSDCSRERTTQCMMEVTVFFLTGAQQYVPSTSRILLSTI